MCVSRRKHEIVSAFVYVIMFELAIQGVFWWNWQPSLSTMGKDHNKLQGGWRSSAIDIDTRRYIATTCRYWMSKLKTNMNI